MENTDFSSSLRRGVFLGFVPCPLEIGGRPELSVFSLNVLFMQNTVRDGKAISGTALYEPDLSSYKQEKDVASLEYHNTYGHDDRLVIEYNRAEQRYHGEKTINGKCTGMADGKEWKMFFVHFTSLGLANGEHCKFDVLPAQEESEGLQ